MLHQATPTHKAQRQDEQRADALQLRREYGLTRVATAKRLGISDRALRRYLDGRRVMPESVRRALDVWLEDNEPLISEQRRQDAAEDDVPYPSRLPLHVFRYKRPQNIGGGKSVESDIIIIDVNGYSNAAIVDVLRSYWNHFKNRDGRRWDLRFLINIEVTKYFEKGRPDDPRLRSRVRGENSVPIWVPPGHFVFYRPPSRAMRTETATFDDTLAQINDNLEAYKLKVTGLDYFIRQIAFIPIRGSDKR